MTRNRRAPSVDRRSPVRKAHPTRRSASGHGDRIASAADVAGFLREDCRALRDSLQLEMVAAQYYLRMRAARSAQGVPIGEAVSAGVLAELARRGDPLSRAILRAFDYLGAGHPSTDAAGAGLLARFADAGTAYATRAWRATEGGHRGEFVLFCDFEYPLGARHSIALFVEPRGGGVVKHIGLMPPMADLGPGDPFHPSTMEPLELAAAGALLGELLTRSFRSLDTPETDDYRVLIAAARARSMDEASTPVSRPSPRPPAAARPSHP